MIDTIKKCCSIMVLPTVYDESLSYYEQINKLVYKMNEIINFANGELSVEIRNYINEMFNGMMINAIYDEQNETITLKMEGKNNG